MAGPTRKSPSKPASPQGKSPAPARAPAGGSKAGMLKGGSAAARPAASSAAGAVARLKSAGSSNVARYLADKGAPALIKGIGALQKLRRNEQTHDDAGQKLKQSEKAVEIPKSEEQSEGNAGQVNMLDARPKPAADDARAKSELQNTLAANIPRTIEDVDNFKTDRKAQIMGADVMKVVQGDKDAVISTFQDMERTPPPIPSDHKPEALPPQEAAPPTAVMNLGHGLVAPLQKEHTDVSKFTKEADNKLQEEGVTQEQLDMVDSGDLAAANKEKKGMEKMAKDEPLAIQKFAQQEAAKVDTDLSRQEKAEREGMRAKRRAALGATAAKQKGTKTALEKKRDEVADKINGIYKAAQDKVKKKLADLETMSMRRFDAGNANATKEFEDAVNREFAAFKADRYSGLGRLRKVRDWLLGMDDLPGVKAIFERNRAIFVKTINKLVEEITADNKRVIQECKDELAKAKKEIKDFVDKLEPSLKDIGKKSAEEMDAKLDDLDRFVAKKEQELQDKLKDKQQAAIKAIDEKIEKMKEAMSGALAKLGKLLLLAAKKFFSWALEKAGFSLSDIEGIINKGVAVLKAIFTKPIQFVKNLIKAASTGFTNFGKNFLKRLKDAVFEWLTGSLEGVTLPQTWDLKGILSLVFQLVGLTYQNIRSHLVKLIPEPVVRTLETGFTLVKTLITEGPMAAWEQLKEIAGEMKDAFIDAVKDWIKWKVVEEAIKTILAIFIPGAGIVKAIIAIYDTIVFFIQKAKSILKMVGNFLGSIAEIAAGNIGTAANALEEGLARALKLVIDFLARFLRLTGITNAIKKTIQKIRGKVDNVISKVAKWIVSKAKGLIGRLKGKTDDKPDNRTETQKRADLDKAVREANVALEEEGRRTVAQRRLAQIMQRYRLTRAEIVVDERKKGITIFHAELEINPIAKSNKVGEMDYIDPPISVTPNFFCKKSLDKADFKRQIDIQESTINAMDVYTWLANRRRFEREGRSAEGTKLQRQLLDAEFIAFRARAVAERANVYKTKFNMTAPEARKKAEGFANKLLAYTTTETGRRRFKNSQLTDAEHDGKVIENELFKKVALHALDQVAGGSGTDIVGLGGAREDFSLGAQWKGQRIDNLEKKVKQEVKGKKEDEQKRIRMSVKLPVTYE